MLHFAQIFCVISALASDGIMFHTVEISFGGVLHCWGAFPKTGMWKQLQILVDMLEENPEKQHKEVKNAWQFHM